MARLEALESEDEETFDQLALSAFRYQVSHGEVYAGYVSALGRPEPTTWTEIPPLPVGAFKLGTPVTTFPLEAAEVVFESSGTGQGPVARHAVRDLHLYHALSARHFARVFGQGPITLVAHLPGYGEKADRSSLVSMVSHLIRAFGDAASGFFLDEIDVLHSACEHAHRHGRPLLLFGAAFGLLDLIERGPVPLPPDSRVIETGGMKTRRREIDRETLHATLAKGFGITETGVRSEYGMCELMSQAYTRRGGVFLPPPWMRFAIVDPENAFRALVAGRPGALLLCDLANVHTVSCVLTEDLAVATEDGFEVLGRLPGTALRGCNALLERI